MSETKSLACGQCGSTKVMPDVPLLDAYGDGGGFRKQSVVAVAGEPEAWFAKDRAYGAVSARICGDCGFTELWTSNCQELYEKYRKAAHIV